MDLSRYDAACGDCAALCCMAFAFEAGDRFPDAKPRGVPCRHLSGHRCGIYGERAARGFHGCASFTCFGAGQAVTRGLFGGRSWREDDALREPMAEAFQRLCEVQEARFLLETMAFAGLAAEKEAEREAMLAALDPGGEWSMAALDRAEAACPPGRARDWMAGIVPGGAPA